MEDSLTGTTVETTGAEITSSPTSQEQQVNTAENNQETNSGTNTQESVSDDTANTPTQTSDGTQKQTQENGGGSTTDDGLAKFAKGQGFDLTTASDDVKRALKIAHDNQVAFRTKDEGKKITDTAKALGGTDVEARMANLEYERETDRFWSGDNRDKSLESSMVEILNEKAEAHGKDYAFQLSRDLDTLYGLAQLKNGASNSNVDIEAIRREERESINRSLSASAPNAHATTTGHTAQQGQVTEEWLANEYDPSNPEHVKLADAAYAQR